MNNLVSNKGITLAALVITIILLLILSGVGITAGRDSIENARLAARGTELQMMQDKVNELEQNYRKGDDSVLQLGRTLQDLEQDKQKQAFDGAKEEKKQLEGIEEEIIDQEDYRYYDKATIESLGFKNIDQEFLVNVKRRKVISLDGIKYKEKTIWTVSGLDDDRYNVEYKKPISGISFNLSSIENKLYINNIETTGDIKKYTIYYGQGSSVNQVDWKIAKTETIEPNCTIEVLNEGVWYVKIVDTAGNESVNQTTVVISRMTIADDLQDVFVAEGKPATFSFNVAETGNGSITYQWYKCTSSDGANKVAIEGATNAVYTIPEATMDMNNTYYYCEIVQTNQTYRKELSTRIAKLTVGEASIYADVTELTLSKGQTGTVNIMGEDSGEYTIANTAQSSNFSKNYEDEFIHAEINGNVLTVVANKYTPNTITLTVKEENKGKTIAILINMVNKYLVTLNAGTGITINPSEIEVEYGKKYGTLPIPTREHYRFKGWTIEQEPGENPNYITADTTVTQTGAHTLYAQWEAFKYTVNFDKNDENATGEMEAQTFTYNTAQNLSQNTFQHPNYPFACWNTASDGSGTTYLDKQEVINLTATENGTVTLYAQWGTYLKANTTATENGAFLGTSITRDKIKKVSFTNSIDGHTVDNTTCWDVSKQSNGGVLLWATGDDTNGYEVVIGQNGGVVANASSAYLFAYIGNSIDATIDLTNFDTSNVTNMSYLFYNCRTLPSLNVSGLDTSNVTTMEGMFAYDYALSEIDVSSFNTSKVKSMNTMFANCSNLATIYASSSFVTTAVENSTDMFTGSTKLVGGAGTVYDASHINHTYAHIDGGTSNPGYFSNGYLELGTVNSTYSSDFGKIVTGYTTGNSTVDNRIWRLFYADNNYAYLISDSIGNNALNNLPGFGTSTISSVGEKINKKYTQNSSWELKSDGTNINSNIQGLQTLLDTTNWNDYKADYALWAVGAPSLEMFVASYNATHEIQLDCSVEENATGYKIGKNTSGGEVENYSFYVSGLGYSSEMDEAIYSPSTGAWWLSSPSANDKSNEMFVEIKGSVSYNYYGNSKRIRPVVAVPISKLGDGITITSKYFYKDYTVTFNANGGTASEDTRTVAEDTRIGTLPTARKTGYQFLGWFTENGEQISENTIMGNQDVTYYAHWQEANLKANTTATADGTFLGTSITRDKIKSISFATSIDGHTVDNTTCWDVSQQSNGGVLLWATGDNTNGYDVVIGQNGGVFANSSSAYLFAYIGNSINATLNLSNLNTSKVTDMEFLFYNCKNVSTLDVSEIDTSNVNDMHYMFSNCQNVGTLNVSNFDTSNVTNLGNMFQNCSSLTSINVNHFNTSSVTNMQGMYQGCSGLTGLDLSNFDTTQVTNMSNIFDGCSGLTSLNISSFNTSMVTNMQAMLKNCSSLTTIELGGFDTGSVTTMEYMFYSCSGITTLNLSNFNTTNVTKINNMFQGCTDLITIYASSNFVTTGITDSANGNDMFIGATNIVGGAGTVYDASNVSYTYAHIDEGTSNPGYFTNGGYTITFDKNDASATGTMEPQTIPFNKTEKLRKNTFQKTNYSFAGWNTEPDGSGTRYTYQQEVNNLGNITLYAQWKTEKAEIEGTFYSTLQAAINAVTANGPQKTIILLRDTSEKLEVAAGKNIVFDLQDFTISNNGVNPVINNFGTLAISNGTITSSTTQGAINNKSKANLTISGGSIITTGTRQAIYNEGGTIEITGNAYLSSKATVETNKNRGTVHNTNGTVTISGGTIVSTNGTNNGIAVSNESKMTITGGTIRSESSAGTGLYNSKTTLTIGTKDGNMVMNTPIIQGKKYGLSSTVDLSFYDGVIKGITSATDNDQHLKNIEDDYVIAHKTETIDSDTYDVVYLKEKDTVTFDPNGGTIANGTRKVKPGDPVGTLPTATKSGYMLDGWYTSAEGGIKITENTIIDGDITFYAHWKSTYTVTFDPNGGKIINGTKLVESGTALGDLPKATRAGFQCDGWYTSKEGGESITEDTIINEDVTYYAHWTVVDTAEINDVSYNTLQEAVNQVPKDGTEVTINILTDSTEYVKTSAGQNIIINLQNNTLSNNGSSKVIDNYGTIKLTNGTINSVVQLSSTIDNYAGGTVIIDGVTMISTGERQAVYNNGGTVEIRGNSTISSTTTGNAPSGEPRGTIQNFNGGTVTIEDGTIILDTQGSITNAAITNSANSTVKIGKKDGTVNMSSPEIRGTTYGIINTGTIKFYDGIVKGVLGSVDGNIAEVEDNYERKDDTETINGTTYYTTYLTQINNGLLNNAANALSTFFSAFGQ